MIRLRPVMSDRARTFGRYPSSAAARRALSMVRFETDAPGVKTRETADWLTAALRATSSDVTLSFPISLPSSRPRPSARCPVTSGAHASEALRRAVAGITRPDLLSGAAVEHVADPGGNGRVDNVVDLGAELLWRLD